MKYLTRSVRHVLLLIVIAFAAFPIYWMANTALSSTDDLFAGGQPVLIQLANLVNLPGMFSEVPIATWLGNSAVIAFGTTLLSLLVSIHAAYALSRYRFHGKGLVSFLLLSTQMMPGALIIVPLFGVFSALGLLNGLGGLVIANSAFVIPVATFILKSAIDSAPFEVEEAARVDGCARFGVISMVVNPLIFPSIGASAVIAFFDGWNEFMFANIFLSDERLWPASVGLASFVGEFFAPMNQVMAGALLFALPAIVFFLIAQKRIVSGITAGSVKG